jgi:hypothetical protein
MSVVQPVDSNLTVTIFALCYCHTFTLVVGSPPLLPPTHCAHNPVLLRAASHTHLALGSGSYAPFWPTPFGVRRPAQVPTDLGKRGGAVNHIGTHAQIKIVENATTGLAAETHAPQYTSLFLPCRVTTPFTSTPLSRRTQGRSGTDGNPDARIHE